MADQELARIRSEIDQVDAELISLLEHRMRLIQRVAEYKKEQRLAVFDGKREQEVLDRCGELVKNSRFRISCLEIMQKIMETGREYQSRAISSSEPMIAAGKRAPALRVGYQGVPGSYSHQAIQEYFKTEKITERNFQLFEDVVKAVVDKEIDCGVLPIENSSTGGILEVYDLLSSNDCRIVAEKIIKIEHNLMALEGVAPENIRKVYSHPQGFSQCREFFKQHPDWELIPYFNTAKSAEMVSTKKDTSAAAVASRQAAELYGLKILESNINFNKNNYTRFVFIAKEMWENDDADKITVVVTLPHKPGTLYTALGCFYRNGLNMTNIESRPLKDRTWEYSFHMDFCGNLRHRAAIRAIEELQENSTYCRILGNYKADDPRG